MRRRSRSKIRQYIKAVEDYTFETANDFDAHESIVSMRNTWLSLNEAEREVAARVTASCWFKPKPS